LPTAIQNFKPAEHIIYLEHLRARLLQGYHLPFFKYKQFNPILKAPQLTTFNTIPFK
jgi:hypothetical protein